MNNHGLVMKEFAERLQLEVKRKGWSLAELARKAGVPKTTVHHWTCGKVPGIMHLRKVAEVLGVPLHDLVFGEPDPHSESSVDSQVETALITGLYRVHLEKVRD